ncbi:MFS family permease [Microbacterium terrae]|uniref:MFS transporter n=1 Tax=Microbacterium terrae TaxID=69369 RepID=UPI0005EC7AD2|nr:MFS transporter [Microbacterium terrae]MBP1079441.1 MFS family permease [Microbacterium terrae]
MTTILLACVLEAVALGAIMISIALPSILEEFPTDQGGWLLSTYYLAGAVAAPILGKCADLYGKKRMLLITMGISGLGIIVAVLAPSFGVLLIGRTMQGVILATLSLTYSLIRDIFPPKPAAFAASITVTGMGIFGIVTPLLVGILIAAFGWRGMFGFDAVWTLGLLLLIAVVVPESSLRRKARPDILGGVLLALGVVGILLYVSLGRQLGWVSLVSLASLIGGIAFFTWFLLHTRRVAEPIIDGSLFRRRPVIFVVLFGAVGYALSATIGQLMPLLALTSAEDGGTYGLGLTTVEYAAVETPRAIAAAAVGILLGILVARGRSPRMFMVLGMSFWLAATLWLIFFNDTQYFLTIGALLIGTGGGMVNASLPNVVIQATPADNQGSVAGTVQLCQTGFGAVAPVLMFAILAPYAMPSSTGGIVYQETGFTIWLTCAAVTAAVLLLLAATVLRPRKGDVVSPLLVSGKRAAATEGGGEGVREPAGQPTT